MTRNNRRIAVPAMLLLFTSAAIGQAPETAKDPDGEAVKTLCVTCHELDVVKAAHKTPAEWAETIDKMKELGAELTAEEQSRVLRYLERTQGREQRNIAEQLR